MTQTEPGRAAGPRGPATPGGNPLVRLKVRLQFTGWLQYVLNAVAALLVLVVASLGWIVGVWRPVLFWLPLGIGVLLLGALVVDLVTVKLGFRPPEPLPPPRDDLGAFDLMRFRRSCRSFQPRNLSDTHRTVLLESVERHSRPESLIGRQAIRFEYVAARLTVWPVVGAHEFLVAIAPRGYDRMSVIDVGRSLQRVVLDATRMGLGTCWIGPGADHESIVGQLGERFDPEKDHIICVCAVGYRSRFVPLFIRAMGRMQHRRRPLSSLFFADPTLQTPLDLDAAPFARFGRCFEVCQWSPSSYNGQTTRCVGIAEEDGASVRAARFDFYAATASRYYAAVALGIWCADWEAGCDALGIAGHFATLAPRERGVGDAPEPPRYDVSWVLDGR